MIGGECEIAILVAARTIAIVAVDHGFLVLQRQSRHPIAQCEKLLKERTREIEWAAIGLWIPLVRPPLVRIVDMDARMLAEVRDDGFPCEFALAVVEVPLIAPAESPLLAAIGTKFWRRDVIPLARDDRRDFCIEREVVLGNFEGGRALLTRLLHTKKY